MPDNQASESRTPARRIVGYLPVIVLALVALNQVRLAKTTDLSAWKGGGFGMFSTLDRPRARQVRCHLVGGSNDVPLAIPAELRDLRESVKTNPTEKKLIRLGREIAATLDDRLPGLETIRVEVWRRSLDLDSGSIRTEKWREAAYRIGSGDD
jgi:hypothetical protein